MKKSSLIIPNWFICLIVTIPVLVGMLAGYYPINYFDLKLYDFLSELRQRDSPSPVVVVEIDRKSINTLGPWPWPRSQIADLISNISAAKAKAIGIDILYEDKLDNPALREIENLRNSLGRIADRGGEIAHARELLDDVEKKMDQDAQLVSAIQPAKNVVLALRFNWDPVNKEPPREIPGWLKKNTIDRKPQTYTLHQLINGFHNPLLAFNKQSAPRNIDFPFRELAAVASRYGHINHRPDFDGILRSENLLINYQGQLFPSMALQMAMAYSDKKFPEAEIISNRGIVKAIRYGDERTQLSADMQMLIDYNESPFMISRFSFSDVLDNKIPKGLLEDKLVLVGITDPDFTKIYRTPTGHEKSGVEISAEALENIVNKSPIQRPSWAWFPETLVLLYFGIILLYITDRLNGGIGSAILATFLLGWWTLAAFLFINNGLWFYTFPHTLTVILGFGLQRLNHYQAAPKKIVEEHTEMNKMLGLSFQAQGLLDMAFDSFRKCSLNDVSVKEAIYNLALDFERKRMFNKAVSAYEYLLKGGKHKDAHERIWRLRRVEAKSMGVQANGDRLEKTLLYNNDTQTKPTLGRYEVIKEIGKGAIGTVYLGRDPKINRKVAIKTLRYDEVNEDQLAEVKERFFREAEAAGRLSHPNIVTIYDAGEDYDITYMAMEYLDGHDLTRHCKKNNLLPVKVILNIIIRVAFALDYAHKHNVVHRDIKPANVMLTEKGHVKVTDFGIARLTSADSTQTGVILGTPNYMSPEQVLGKKLDGRSDIFSLGAVFYELMTGEKPFKSSNIGNLMHNIASAKYRPVKELRADTPPCCEELIRKMMTKSRSKRFSNAGEVVIEAQKCMGEL